MTQSQRDKLRAAIRSIYDLYQTQIYKFWFAIAGFPRSWNLRTPECLILEVQNQGTFNPSDVSWIEAWFLIQDALTVTEVSCYELSASHVVIITSLPPLIAALDQIFLRLEQVFHNTVMPQPDGSLHPDVPTPSACDTLSIRELKRVLTDMGHDTYCISRRDISEILWLTPLPL